MTEFRSIEETGAKPGDKVRCLSVDESLKHRFHVGQIYDVIDFCGNPSIRGSSDYRGAGDNPGWQIPWKGFGATWERL
jgi:hypothetical protein